MTVIISGQPVSDNTPFTRFLRALFVLSGLILIQLSTLAQNRLLLCTNYDASGNVSGDFNTWKIGKTGNFMFVMLQSSVPLKDTVYLSLQKTYSRKDTNYYDYDHYYLVPDVSGKWAVNKYIFTKPGNYRLIAADRNTEQILAMFTTEIGYMEDVYADPYFTDTWYYDGSVIFYYAQSDSSGLSGRNTQFAFHPGENRIYLYVEQLNKRPLKTDHLVAKIYASDTHQLINTYSYSINRSWYWTYVPVVLEKPGNYDVELYNEDDIYINHAALRLQ